MSIQVGDNFSYQGTKPLDGRIKYDTLADMKAVADAVIYEGCIAYCVATAKTYQWKSTNTVDADTGKWREFETGGGGTYTAGTGIDITNDVISTKQSQAGDIDEIVDIYPAAGELVSIVNAFNNGDIYSTDERMIGVWVDNKPLYQKTWNNLEIVLTNNSWTDTVTLSDADKIISAFGMCTYPNNTYSGSFETRRVNGSDVIKIMNESMYGNTLNTLIIQYTKTTDSPVSVGSETEYSTTEKIVGTWIDGEPVYQKTISKTINNTTGSWTDFETMANVNVLEFVGYSTDGSQNYSVPYSSGAAYLTFRHESGKIQYITGNSNWMNNNTVYLTIQYTKTT